MISDDKKLEILWKRFEHGVSMSASAKSEHEEFENRRAPTKTTDIWNQDSLIPEIPGEVDDVVVKIESLLVLNPTDTTGNTWVAVVDPELPVLDGNRIKDFIPNTFNPAYEIRLFKDELLTEELQNSLDAVNWLFDYATGILWFPNGYTSEDFTELYISGYSYIGTKGISQFSGGVIDFLLEPFSGDYNGGYVQGWTPEVTRISDAFDQINRALKDFTPRDAPYLNELVMDMPGKRTNLDQANYVLSIGHTDNTGNTFIKPVPGNQVAKIRGTNLETTMLGPFSNGKAGVLTAFLNDTASGTVTLATGDNSGLYNNLYVYHEESDKPTGKVHEFLYAKAVDLNLADGMNSVYLTHSLTGTASPFYVVREAVELLPTAADATITPKAGQVTNSMSSGIPHYTDGSKFTLTATTTNLATDLYLDTRSVVFSTGTKKAGPDVWASPGFNGLPNVLTKGANYPVTAVNFEINSVENVLSHGSVTLTATAQNTNGKSTAVAAPNKINFMRGSSMVEMTPVEEIGIPVIDLGTVVPTMPTVAKRVILSDSNAPVFNGQFVDLVQTNSNNAAELYEGKIVGGSLIHSKVDYTTYLPSGPNYSTHNTVQYATFAIVRKNVSQFKIDVIGKYSGLTIKLPGIAAQPLSSNGWMDAYSIYEGWGTPGREVRNGCALQTAAFGGTQTVHVTFGPESSSYSNSNLILVRFKLTSGDHIDGLRFIGV